MSTPEGTSGHSGQQENRPQDQLDQPLEPIDPTLTFDAYFEKHPTSSTAADESAASTDDVGSTHPEPAHPEHDYSEHDYSEPTQTEPTHAEHTPSEPDNYEPSHTEHTHSEPAYAEPAYTETGHGQSARTSLIQGSEPSETVAPAGYSAATWTPTTVDQTHSPTETDLGPRAVRMRTVVLGLVFLVIAGAVLVGQLTDVTVNGGAIVLALMIGGGLLLIAGARRA